MKLNEWYDYKLNETQQKLLNEDIEVYDLEAFIKQETEDLEEPFWFKKIAIFEGPRKNGCFVDYEAIGKFFGSPNDEVEIDTNDFDPEEPNVIYMRPTGSFKCSINDIINGAPVQVMKGKDFFTKATYNDRCYDNYCELVDFLDKIGYFEPRRLDAGLEEGLAVWAGPDSHFSDYHMEILPIDGETTPQMFKEILEENGYEVFDGITEAEFFKDDTLDWEPDDEHKYCWLVNGSMARWWVFKSFESMLKWFKDGNTNHFGNCCSSKPINESLITESLNEGRYFDFQKKLEEKKKELRELINKLNACKTDEEKEQVLDSIDIVQNDIANLEGELAEIRYIDNGNANDYSGYESLNEMAKLPYHVLAWRLYEIMCCMNNENAYMNFIYIWPDGETKKQCEYDFGDKESYEDLKQSFERIYKRYHKDGLYTNEQRVLDYAHEIDKKLGLEPIVNYGKIDESLNESVSDDYYYYSSRLNALEYYLSTCLSRKEVDEAMERKHTPLNAFGSPSPMSNFFESFYQMINMDSLKGRITVEEKKTLLDKLEQLKTKYYDDKTYEENKSKFEIKNNELLDKLEKDEIVKPEDLRKGDIYYEKYDNGKLSDLRIFVELDNELYNEPGVLSIVAKDWPGHYNSVHYVFRNYKPEFHRVVLKKTNESLNEEAGYLKDVDTSEYQSELDELENKIKEKHEKGRKEAEEDFSKDPNDTSRYEKAKGLVSKAKEKIKKLEKDNKPIANGRGVTPAAKVILLIKQLEAGCAKSSAYIETWDKLKKAAKKQLDKKEKVKEPREKKAPYKVIGQNAEESVVVFEGTYKQCQKYIEQAEKEDAETYGADNPDTYEYFIESLREDLEEPELETFEDKMNFLAKDEQEAIDGYDKVINLLDPEKDAIVIEQLGKIKTEEIAHKTYLEEVQKDHDLVYTEPLEPEEELEEDIEKHDTLNPVLFDGEELKPEIKEAIQKIVTTFVEELAEDDIAILLKDIVLLGSNVSYNYTKDSDLDVHLIVDSNQLKCPQELQDKLYGAYRSIFNKNYDINVKGIPVEIFVELDEPRAKSNGIYSLNNGWIKKPEQAAIPELDKEAFDNLFGEWEERYNKLIGE